MRVRWTTPAAQDLYNIVRRIQQDNPDAAAKVAQTLHDGCGKLGSFPACHNHHVESVPPWRQRRGCPAECGERYCRDLARRAWSSARAFTAAISVESWPRLRRAPQTRRALRPPDLDSPRR